MMARYVNVGTHYNFGLQEMGEAIVKDAFRCAAKAVLAMTPSWQAQTIAQSVAFVQGSGLETTIELFALSLDPEVLRSTFTWKLRHALASSSAIIHNGS